MLKSYLKIAFRNLWRGKGFSFINITGLAIGMASAILILLWIQNELSYDKFHENSAVLYKVWNRQIFDNKLQCWDNTPKILGPTLLKEYPDIANSARVNNRWFITRVGDKNMSTRSNVVDPAFLSMFSFPMIKGDPKTALNSVYSIVLTERMAKRMFGQEDAYHRTISIDKDNFTVTGILRDPPINTEFDFDYLLPFAYYDKLGENDMYWGNNSVSTYVQLKPGASLAAVDAKIRDITIKHSGHTEQEEVFLHPLTMQHLWSNFENGKLVGGQIEVVRMFGIIAAFILLIACINFMNLSTARSEKRAKEVGIRKVSGAHRSLLIGQFLGESLLITFISGLLALLIVQLALPAFDQLVNKPLYIPFDSPGFWIASLLFVLFTGTVAGSYPAFFLSSFKPISVLKGTFRKAHALINPRKVLVVLQFSFALILIISTVIIVRQIRHAQDRESGYERGQLVYHWVTLGVRPKYPLLKNDLLASGAVVSVTATSAPMTDRFSDTWGITWLGKNPNDKTDFDRFSEDEQMAKTTGIKVILGRDMDLAGYPTDSTAMLLNESAVKAMGFKDPIGQVVNDDDIKYHVVGVIRDFVLSSPYDPMRPMIIEGARSGFNIINMRLSPAHSTADNLRTIGLLFKKYGPEYPFEYHFVDQDYARKFDGTQKTAALTGLFAGLTIFISCLGLFGLATYMAENRIKEIGVRKVLGASVLRITTLLSKDFLALVVISIVIATPIAWFVMHNWLQSFSYRIDIEWWVFALAGLLSIVISLATVSYQAIRAALANPVRSLRSE
jgi:putative ABC transport system permease protein